MEQLAYDDPHFLADLHHWSKEYMPDIDQRIIAMRRKGTSWAKIGQEIDCTNEWARQRFLRSIRQREHWLEHGELKPIVLGRPRKEESE